MDQNRKPGAPPAKDISDLKARLGLKRPDAAGPAPAPGPGMPRPTGVLPTGCATVMRAVPFAASATISTRLHSWTSNFVFVSEVNKAPPLLFIPGR